MLALVSSAFAVTEEVGCALSTVTHCDGNKSNKHIDEHTKNTTLTAVIVYGCLIGTVLLGRIFRRLLHEDYLSADSRAAVKMGMGLVAATSALVLWFVMGSV